MEISLTGMAGEAPSRPRTDEPALRAAAREFEAAFLAEMLKHGGVNTVPDGFGGGPGEDAFADFLTREHARLLSERGGLGLAEQIFEAMKARQGG